jgi:hypothetical protein
MNRTPSMLGAWMPLAFAVFPLPILIWAMSATSGTGFA